MLFVLLLIGRFEFAACRSLLIGLLLLLSIEINSSWRSYASESRSS